MSDVSKVPGMGLAHAVGRGMREWDRGTQSYVRVTRREVPPVDRAVAYARRAAFLTASGMTSRQLRSCVADYRQTTGGDPAEGTEEALQLRMIRSLLRRRTLNLSEFERKVRRAHQR